MVVVVNGHQTTWIQQEAALLLLFDSLVMFGLIGVIPVRESLRDHLKITWSDLRSCDEVRPSTQMPDGRQRCRSLDFTCERVQVQVWLECFVVCVWQLRGGRLCLSDGVAWESHPHATVKETRSATGRRRGRWLFRRGRMMGQGQLWRVCFSGGGVEQHCVAVLGWWRGFVCVCVSASERAINQMPESQV